MITYRWETSDNNYERECFVRCQKCRMQTPPCSSPEQARAKWNHRHADDSQKRLLPALTGLPDAIADHCCGRCPSFKQCFASEFKPECGIANVMRLADELRGVLESGE